MSIATQVKVSEHEQRIAKLEELLKSNALQKEIEELKSRLDALESRRVGRPPKEDK